jgi:hypothetical protein
MSSPTSVTLNGKSGSSAATPVDYQIRTKLLHKLGIYGGGRGGSPPSDITAPSSSQASAQPMHMAPLSAAQIRRDRILRGMGVGYTLKSLPPDGSAVRNPLQGVRTVTEPLKSTSPVEETMSASTSADSTDGMPRRKTRIMFEEQVQVMPIPTRYEYSDRIKSRIWSNRHELQENAERNAVEFAAEGWNWRTVTEDDGTSRMCFGSICIFQLIHLDLTMQFDSPFLGMYICSQSGELVHPIHLKHLTMNHPSSNEADNGAPVEMYDEEEVQEESGSHNSLTRGKPVDRS